MERKQEVDVKNLERESTEADKMVSITEEMLFLIIGNRGDPEALLNICEAHGLEFSALNEKEQEFYYATNVFYKNQKEFDRVHHNEDPDFFKSLVKDGTIVKTKGGYVWINCV